MTSEWHECAREWMDGATQMALIRMKMAWWWEDPWDYQHTHGFPLRTDSRWRSLSLWDFPPWEGILPLLKCGQAERLHFDCWSILFPCFSLDKPRPLKQAYWTLALFPLGGNLSLQGGRDKWRENADKWRLLPSMLWGPCAKTPFSPDLWDPAVCFSLSIRLNCVKLYSVTLSHKGWVENYKFIFTRNLSQDFFSGMQ